MGNTIANPENIREELLKLKNFYETQQAALLEQQEAAEREAAEKREAELEASRIERHAEANALARQLMIHTKAVDKLLKDAAEHLRARVELAREIKRVAPDKARAFGNIFEQQPPTSGAVTASGLGYYVRMPIRSGTSLTDHDARALNTFDLIDPEPIRKAAK